MTLFAHPGPPLTMVVGLGLPGTGVAYILYYFIVKRLGVIVASGVIYIPPAVVLLIGVILIGEPVKSLDIVAMVVILPGVGLLQSGKNQYPQIPERIVGNDARSLFSSTELMKVC